METFKKYQPESLFHLATQPFARLSYAEPQLTFDANVGGTVNVFEAVRKTAGDKVLVNIASEKCLKTGSRSGAAGKTIRWAVMALTAPPRGVPNLFSALI